MPELKDLKEQMTKLALEAQTIVDDEKMAMPDKREKLDGLEADLKKLSDEIKEGEYLAEQRKKFSGLAEIHKAEDRSDPVAVTIHQPTTKSIGERIVDSDPYKAELGQKRPQGWNKVLVQDIETKATLTETTGGGTAGSGLAQPTVLPGIMSILFQALTVEDLIPGGSTSSALVRYLKETTATNAAAAVAEGTAKPASALVFSAVDEPVRKLATTIKVTDEMFQDVPQLRSYVDGRLMLFVRIATEAALLSGAGAPSLTGFLNRAGLTAAQALATDSAPDAIYKDITKIRIASFLEPDGIVVHPTNWQTIRLSKDSNLQYFGGGPFTAAYGNPGGMAPDMLWGKRVVVTTAMTLGTALVGAFAAASQLFNNGGMTVEATNSNEDDFLNNLVALRAERRLALAVYRPAAFSTVTGLL